MKFNDLQIEMAHGAGGKASRRLIEGLLVPILCEGSAGPLGDAAFVQMNGTRLAITADSFVVKPLNFPGGFDRRIGREWHGERPSGFRRPSRGSGRHLRS